jgi:hypothetical protein
MTFAKKEREEHGQDPPLHLFLDYPPGIEPGVLPTLPKYGLIYPEGGERRR